MQNVNYTEALKSQLELIEKAINVSAKEVPGKTIEQLLAEIQFLKEALEEAKHLIQ